MKVLLVLCPVLALCGCSASYGDLEAAFGVNRTTDAKPLQANSFFITSRRHGEGAVSFNGSAQIRSSAGKIELTPGVPLLQSIAIPADNIEYCGMTCFGTSDPWVNLLIPRTETSIIVKGRELLDWCWDSKKPMISGADERDWKYNNKPLPPQDKYTAQLASRQAFDAQVRQSCLGY